MVGNQWTEKDAHILFRSQVKKRGKELRFRNEVGDHYEVMDDVITQESITPVKKEPTGLIRTLEVRREVFRMNIEGEE